ncbi:hypothetical protein PV326_006437, partial [Microctonus aethiopoides]
MTSQINEITRDENQIAEDEARKTITKEMVKFESINGPTTLTEHEIRVKPGQQLIKFRYSPRNPEMQTIIDDEVSNMLSQGVIEESASPWSSPATTSDVYTILQAAQALLQSSPQLKVDVGVVRMSPEKFNQLIEILNVSLTKQNTKFRQSIGPYERLTVFL